MSETHFTQGNAAIFIQPEGPAGDLTFLGCHEIASIDEPLGDYTPFWCPDPDQPKRFVPAGQTFAPPAAVTTQIIEDIVGSLSLLREQVCPFGLYVNLTKCGKKSLFDNAELTWIVDVQKITNRSTSNIAAREGDERMERAYDLSAQPPVIEIREVAALEQALPSPTAEELRDVIFCNLEQCAEGCGPAADICEDGIIGADAGAGVTAEVILTTDKGVTWTDGAVDPFAVDEDILSVTCFAIDKDTTRWLVARGQEATPANPAEIGYSDDSGASWTLVDVEAAGTRSATMGGSLWSLDKDHIWFCTSDGYIFFSSDGGLTWTNQEAGIINVNDWNGIHFANENVGYVVGDSGVVAKTTDGGITWAATTAVVTGTPDLNCVWVFDEDTMITGGSTNIIYKTNDGGATWTALHTAAGVIADIQFVNDYVGWATDTATILRTRNGGNTWEVVSGVPTGASEPTLNALHACNENTAYFVGADSSGNGAVYRVNG